MYYAKAAAIAILATQISARAVSKVSKRDVIIDSAGNTQINFNDNTISFGSLNPVDVINSLYDNCYDAGDCNGAPYTMTTTVPSTGYGTQDVDLTITISTGFFTPWVKNGMVAALAAAAANTDVSQYSTVSYANSPSCETCPVYAGSIGQYTFPQSIEVSYDPTGSDHSVISVGFSIDLPTTPGFCGTLANFGAALAAPISATTGSALTLLGLFCGTS